MIYVFCTYIVAIGLLGIYRTDSLIPLFINSGIAIITLAINFGIRKKITGMVKTMIGWLGLLILVYGYQAFAVIAAHTNPRPGAKYIFASMALMALVTLVVTTKKKAEDRFPPAQE